MENTIFEYKMKYKCEFNKKKKKSSVGAPNIEKKINAIFFLVLYFISFCCVFIETVTNLNCTDFLFLFHFVLNYPSFRYYSSFVLCF